jgi:hypothetical protein
MNLPIRDFKNGRAMEQIYSSYSTPHAFGNGTDQRGMNQTGKGCYQLLYPCLEPSTLVGLTCFVNFMPFTFPQNAIQNNRKYKMKGYFGTDNGFTNYRCANTTVGYMVLHLSGENVPSPNVIKSSGPPKGIMHPNSIWQSIYSTDKNLLLAGEGIVHTSNQQVVDKVFANKSGTKRKLEAYDCIYLYLYSNDHDFPVQVNAQVIAFVEK